MTTKETWLFIIFISQSIGLYSICYNDSSKYDFNKSILLSCYHNVNNNKSLLLSSFSDDSFIQLNSANKYLIKELFNDNISLFLKYNENRFLIDFAHSGLSKYGRFSVSSGYARQFGKRFSVGLQFDYLLDHAFQYASVHSLSFTVSASSKITDKLFLHFAIVNPARLKYGLVGDDYLPTCFTLHSDFLVNDKLLLFTQLYIDLAAEYNADFGFSFLLHRSLILISSVSLSKFDCAILYMFRSFTIALKQSFHFSLGYSPQFSLIYKFKLS